MYYLVNLKNNILINQILPDILFKNKGKNEKKKKILTLNKNFNPF